MSETQTVVATKSNELARAIESAGLKESDFNSIIDIFGGFFGQAKGLIRESSAIVVNDPTQVTEIKASGAARLKLKAIRTAAEKTRVAMKADAITLGKGIDKANNALLMLIEPEEARLQEQEKIAERMEAERKATLKAGRDAELITLGADPAHYQSGEMNPTAFRQLADGLKAANVARKEAEAKAERERQEAEWKRIEEENAIRAENERLKKEAQERERLASIERDRVIKERDEAEATARKEREVIEATARKEREAAEAKAAEDRRIAAEQLAKERQAREAAEAKEKARKVEEAKIAAAKAKEERKAKAAPDKEKLLALADAIDALEVPVMTSDAGIGERTSVCLKLQETIDFIHDLADKL